MNGGVSGARSAARVLVAVVRHPELWITAFREGRTLARPRWWTRAPFLPVPAPEYLRFRLLTAYGVDGSTAPTPEDVVTYLRWCRAYPLIVGPPGG